MRNLKWKKITTLLLCFALVSVFIVQSAIRTEAKEEKKIILEKDPVTVSVGQTATFTADYSLAKVAFSDIGVVSANPEVATISISDAGNHVANITVNGKKAGVTNIAVYRISNPDIVSYATVKVGMAEKGSFVLTTAGDKLRLIYPDQIVDYTMTLNGKNGVKLALTGLTITEESGMNLLSATGTVSGTVPSSRLCGFYANFYDKANELIARRAVYVKSSPDSSVMTVEWHIPENCVYVVLE